MDSAAKLIVFVKLHPWGWRLDVRGFFFIEPQRVRAKPAQDIERQQRMPELIEHTQEQCDVEFPAIQTRQIVGRGDFIAKPSISAGGASAGTFSYPRHRWP